jgi:hypothetical protein
MVQEVGHGRLRDKSDTKKVALLMSIANMLEQAP